MTPESMTGARHGSSRGTLRGALRNAALFLLPAALLASPVVAAALAIAAATSARRRRTLQLAPAMSGLLVAGLLAALSASLQRPTGTDAASLWQGPLGTWLVWGAAVTLLGWLYTRTSPRDALVIARGSALAAIGALVLATYQVAFTGATQAHLFAFHPNLAAAALTGTTGGVLVGFVRAWRTGWRSAVLVTVGLAASVTALVLAGSRSGLLGATLGLAVFMVLLLPQLRWRPVAATAAAVLLLGLGAWYLDGVMRGPAGPNLVSNSGFEQRLLPWQLAAGSARQALADGTWAVRLTRHEPTAVLARYLVALPVPHGSTGARTAAVLSLDARPDPPVATGPSGDTAAPSEGSGTQDPERTSIPVAVVLDALDPDDTVVARLGVDGWLEAPSTDMRAVGGRPLLPQQPAGAGQRFTADVPPVPAGATSLRLSFNAAGNDRGSYGLIDDVMLAPPDAARYLPGRRPGLFAFLTPALRRLEGLKHPFAASGGRLGMWYLGSELAAARPVFGYGPGSELALARSYAPERLRQPLEHFHSLYVKLLLEGGSVLLATALVLLGTVLLGVLRAALRRAPGSAAAAATLTALLVQSAFDPMLTYGTVILGAWLLVAVAGGDTEDRRQPDVSRRSEASGDRGNSMNTTEHVSEPFGAAPSLSRTILGMRVDAGTYGSSTARILAWAREARPRYVCVANVHMTMEAHDKPDFRAIVNAADMVTSDGMPLVFMLRRLGVPTAERVYGPTLMLHVCEAAAAAGVPVGLYGGSPDVVAALQAELTRRFPQLGVPYAYSPPFRELSTAEDAQVVQAIQASGARILFVGLGCPKQERWMAAHQDGLPLVQVGVGAAFAIHAGRLEQAPAWLQDHGLEWLFRLAVEPRRLWKRYLIQNPRFVVLAGLQLLRGRGL